MYTKTTMNFGFCLTSLFFSGDHSRLGPVPQSSPKEEPLGSWGFLVQYIFYSWVGFLLPFISVKALKKH